MYKPLQSMTEVEQRRSVRYMKYFELYLLFKNCLGLKHGAFLRLQSFKYSFETFDSMNVYAVIFSSFSDKNLFKVLRLYVIRIFQDTTIIQIKLNLNSIIYLLAFISEKSSLHQT